MHLLKRHNEYRIFQDSSRESGKAFYARVGHLFVDKEIRKEMGGPLDSNDEWIWLLVLDPADAIVAFACLNCERLATKREVWFDNAYVKPDHRQHGLHAMLTDLRMDLARSVGAQVLKGLARPTAYISFEARGFEVVRQNGQYRTYQKVLSDAELV